MHLFRYLNQFKVKGVTETCLDHYYPATKLRLL